MPDTISNSPKTDAARTGDPNVWRPNMRVVVTVKPGVNRAPKATAKILAQLLGKDKYHQHVQVVQKRELATKAGTSFQLNLDSDSATKLNKINRYVRVDVVGTNPPFSSKRKTYFVLMDTSNGRRGKAAAEQFHDQLSKEAQRHRNTGKVHFIASSQEFDALETMPATDIVLRYYPAFENLVRLSGPGDRLGTILSLLKLDKHRLLDLDRCPYKVETPLLTAGEPSVPPDGTEITRHPDLVGKTGVGISIGIIDFGYCDVAFPTVIPVAAKGIGSDLVPVSPTVDLVEHGTTVAGIIRELAPSAKLELALVPLDIESVIEALGRLAEYVQVINLSLTLRPKSTSSATDFMGAIKLASQAAVLVGALGNDGECCSPGNMPEMLTVGALWKKEFWPLNGCCGCSGKPGKPCARPQFVAQLHGRATVNVGGTRAFLNGPCTSWSTAVGTAFVALLMEAIGAERVRDDQNFDEIRRRAFLSVDGYLQLPF